MKVLAALSLSFVLAGGLVPAPALAQMADEAEPPLVLEEDPPNEPIVLEDEEAPIELEELLVQDGLALETQDEVADLGDGSYTYTVHDESTGKDDVYTFELNANNYAVITHYEGEATNLVIPAAFDSHAVTQIGAGDAPGAFEGNATLESVTLPSTVVEIGKNAFKGCKSLQSVELPEDLKRIRESAFANCSALQTLNIPEGATTVEKSAFQSCTSLAQVSFPSTFTHIGKSAFSGCVALRDLLIPEAVTTIEDSAFASCTGLQSVSFFTPGSTKAPSIRTIGASAFSGCTGIATLTIPASLVSCGTSKYGPFVGCTGLKSVSFEEGATRVASGLLADCPGIESIDLPEGIVEVGNSAFKNCTALTHVGLPSTLTTIGASAFLQCSALPQISIPQGVTKIGNSAFKNCAALPSVGLPSGLGQIGSSAFEGSGLKSVLVPASVTSVGESAFKKCTALETAEFANAAEDSDATCELGRSAFEECTALHTVTLSNAIKRLNASTFLGCERLQSIALPSSLTSIGNKAFRECHSLRSLTVPEGVKTLGSEAFYDCDGLASVSLPPSVATMGASIFYDCDALYEVELGSGIKAIPNNAFQHCDALSELVIPRGVTKIGEDAFIECTKLASVYTTADITSIANGAFSYPKWVTIYGVAGSYAEQYASSHGIKFQALEVEATRIGLVPANATLRVGQKLQVDAVIEPLNYTGSIAWASSNKLVATVTDSGVVEAVGTGTAQITIRVGTRSASLNVSVYQGATDVRLNKSTLTLEGGQAARLEAKVLPDDAAHKEVAWASSDESVATVDATGKVRGLRVGTATITCETTDGSQQRDTCRVSVTSDAVVAGDVSQLQSAHPYQSDGATSWLYTLAGATALSVTFDGATQLEDATAFLTIYNEDDQEVGTFAGSELAGKTLDVAGNTVRIRLSASGADPAWGFKVSKVEQAAGVKEVRLSKQALRLVTGSSAELSATCDPADAAARVTWTSSNPKVARVSSDGVVTAVSAGFATISANVGGASATCELTVEDPISMGKVAVEAIDDQYFNDEPITPEVTATYDGKTLQEGTDYLLSYKNNGAIGKATVVLTGMGEFAGTKEATFRIRDKEKNTLVVRLWSNVVECEYNENRAQQLILNADVATPKGATSFKNISTDPVAQTFAVDAKTGMVTIPKGTKPGPYAFTARVSAAGNSKYKPASLPVSYTIKITLMKNPLKIKAKKAKVSFTYNQNDDAGHAKNVTVTGARGDVVFWNASTNSTAKRFFVDAQTGEVTVPMGTKAGSYTMVVKATASGTDWYAAGSASASFTIEVTKRANTLSAKAEQSKVSSTYSATSAKTLSSNIVVAGAQGKVTYANVSSNATAKKFTVNNKTGRVSIPSGTKCGTYALKVKVSAAGNANYQAKSVTVSYKVVVTKLANPLSAKATTAKVATSAVAKKAQTVAPIKVTKAQGKVTYTKSSGSSNLTVNAQTGKITVKKGSKKGTYTAKIVVTAAGNKSYSESSKTVTVTIRLT